MPYKIVKHGALWLTINTETHRIKGRHSTREKAMAQRRILSALKKRGRVK